MHINSLKKIGCLLILGICNVPILMAQTKMQAKMQAKKHGLLQSFKTPPDSVKPGVYWYWLNDNITRDGVKKHIEAMVKLVSAEPSLATSVYQKRN